MAQAGVDRAIAFADIALPAHEAAGQGFAARIARCGQTGRGAVIFTLPVVNAQATDQALCVVQFVAHLAKYTQLTIFGVVVA